MELSEILKYRICSKGLGDLSESWTVEGEMVAWNVLICDAIKEK